MLKVKPISGKFKEDHDLIGDMDPFVVLQLDGQKYQTKPNDQGGIAPKWHEQFQFDVTKLNDKKLSIKVYDKDPMKNQHIGENTVDISSWFNNKNQLTLTQVSILKKNHELIGEIMIEYFYNTHIVPSKNTSNFII